MVVVVGVGVGVDLLLVVLLAVGVSRGCMENRVFLVLLVSAVCWSQGEDADMFFY